MSSNKKNPLNEPGQDLKKNVSTGETKCKVPEPDSPITIAMTPEVLFRTEQQGSSSESIGPAFHFVKALKAVNAKLQELYPESEELFKVILISDSFSDSLKEAIRKKGLEELITLRAVTEKNLISELQRTNTHLYLSAEPGQKVLEVLNQGIAAAIMRTPDNIKKPAEDQLRVVFDGDAVLFSDESERVFKQRGLQAFLENEEENVDIPMTQGPMKSFLEVLERLKRKWQDKQDKGLYKICPIRTYLVTSRGAGCAGYRALNTLRMWGLELDEAVFLGGSRKGPTLDKISPHIFFDDQPSHIEAALEVGTVACLVPTSKK